MKKLTFNRIIAFMFILTLSMSCLSLSACSDEDFIVYFGVDTLPQTLDPQRASAYSELLAVRNCFVGLMKLDKNGETVLGVANSYELSSDNLKYTFYLDDCKWNNGVELTADDFVYGITRACKPETKASNIDSLINIKGAKEMLSGQDADFGVYSTDKDTIVFELLTPDTNFLYKLTFAVFMPCNQEFFNKCKGKYGLGTNYILTNGNFKPASWSTKGNFIRLNRTTDDDKSRTEVKSLYISKGTSGKDSITRINDGEIGVTINHNSNYSKINTSKFNIETTYNKNYLIVFNKSSKIGSNKLLTESFAQSVDREYLSSRFDGRFKSTASLLPENSILNGNVINITDRIAIHKYEFSPESARTKFLQGLKDANLAKFPSTKVVTVENDTVKSALTDVVAKWQSNLGAYINIETVKNEKSLLNLVKSGNYSIAFIPISNNVSETLTMFSNGGMLDINSTEYDLIVDEINKTFNGNISQNLLFNALEILSKDASIIPIMSAPSALIWNNEYKDLSFYKTDLTVDFSYVHK